MPPVAQGIPLSQQQAQAAAAAIAQQGVGVGQPQMPAFQLDSENGGFGAARSMGQQQLPSPALNSPKQEELRVLFLDIDGEPPLSPRHPPSFAPSKLSHILPLMPPRPSL